jgi:hypothetical protein
MKKLLFLLFLFTCLQLKSQTQFYFQDFENTSNPSGIDWTFSHTSVSRNNNYWVWGTGTAGDTIGAATYQGTGSLQVWRRARVQGSDVWLVDYGNHANQNRTAQKTFDFSSIPLGSDIDFSFWLLSRGELASNGIYYDYFQVEVNGNLVLGPTVNVNSWTLQNIDLSTYAGNSSVTVVFRWINDGSVANQPPARVDNVRIEYIEPSPLPVTLISFTTECDNGIPLIQWTTASEQNSDYFQIERSRDGENWFPVSKVQAMGNSNTNKDYQFYDITSGKSFDGYYRLKQVDIDGEFKYFGPVSSFCSDYKDEFISEVFPNPTSGEVSLGIRNDIQETVNVSVSDYTGRILYEMSIEINEGYTLKTIDLSKYITGTYLICITTNNTKYIHKVIKK